MNFGNGDLLSLGLFVVDFASHMCMHYVGLVKVPPKYIPQIEVPSRASRIQTLLCFLYLICKNATFIGMCA